MLLRDDSYEPARLITIFAGKPRGKQQTIARAMEVVSPSVMYDIVQKSDPHCWFCASLYAEVVKRYEVIAEVASSGMSEHLLDKVLSALLGGWQSMRPANAFSAVEFARFTHRALMDGRRIELVSLMCPAYSVGRNGIAETLIESSVASFIEAVCVGVSEWRDLISCWRVYVWDERGLGNPLLATTVHPRLLHRKDVAEQLQRSWQLQNLVLERLANRLKMPIKALPFTELNGSIEQSKRILEQAEESDQVVTRSVARMLRHGAEEYRRMGEDISEHRQRFVNDSFVFAAAILKEGEFRPSLQDRTAGQAGINKESANEPLRVMILLESRSHHIGALRLYDFSVNGVGRYVMPVWALPARLRSFYWVNAPYDQEAKVESGRCERRAP